MTSFQDAKPRPARLDIPRDFSFPLFQKMTVKIFSFKPLTEQIKRYSHG